MTWLGSFLASASTSCADSLTPASGCVAATWLGLVLADLEHTFGTMAHQVVVQDGTNGGCKEDETKGLPGAETCVLAFPCRRLRDLAAAGSTTYGFIEDCYLTRPGQPFSLADVSNRYP